VRIHLVFALLISVLLSSAHAQVAALTFASGDFPPFNVDTKEGASGPFVDLIKLVCQRIQTDCVFENRFWRRAMAEVQDGDTLSGVFPFLHLPEREKDFYFIGPVVETTYTFYTGAGDAFQFHGGKDLTGYKIGVYGPSATSKILEQITSGGPPTTIVVEISNLVALKKLSAERYGAKGLVFINHDIAQYLISKEHIENLQATEDVQSQEFYIGLSRKSVSPEIETKFENTFAAMKQSGELNTILRKYGLTVDSKK